MLFETRKTRGGAYVDSRTPDVPMWNTDSGPAYVLFLVADPTMGVFLRQTARGASCDYRQRLASLQPDFTLTATSSLLNLIIYTRFNTTHGVVESTD